MEGISLAIRDFFSLARAWEPPRRSLSLPVHPRVEALSKKYSFDGMQICGAIELAESLYVLDLCDRYLQGTAVGRGLDIGTKNGSYLAGLTAFCPGWDGVERDANRRYWDLTTRRTVGEGMARNLKDCRYIAGDVRALSQSYARITWFLPFVFLEPHQAWGLPARLFDPLQVLNHVWGLLQKEGVMLLINQGEAEFEEQGRLLAVLGGNPEPLGRIESPLSPFTRPRYGWRIRK